MIQNGAKKDEYEMALKISPMPIRHSEACDRQFQNTEIGPAFPALGPTRKRSSGSGEEMESVLVDNFENPEA
jgi:hypothetical protein